MSYTLHIADPDEFRVTVIIPGRGYSPDVLDDAKRRVAELYAEVLEKRLSTLLAAGQVEEAKDE